MKSQNDNISQNDSIMEILNKENVEVIKFLLSRRVDVNAKDVDNNTLLHGAAFRGNVEITKLLVSHGANINAKNDKGQTPLDIAKEKKNTAVIEYLISVGGKSGK